MSPRESAITAGRCAVFEKINSIEELLKQAEDSGKLDDAGQFNSVTNTISKGIELPDSANKAEKQPDQTDHFNKDKIVNPTIDRGILASLEILLSNISVIAGQGTTVKPSNCPAIARAQDYGKDTDGKPACVFQSKDCPYFKKAGFILDNYYKIITCKFSKGI